MTSSPGLFVAGPLIFSIFLPIVIVVLLCFNNRKEVGGYWSFKQATTGIFIMFLTAYVIQFIGKDLIFNNLIEPNNIEQMQVTAINAKTTIMKQRGDRQSIIDKSIAELKSDFDQQKNVTVGSKIQGMVFSILFLFLFALIFASFFKREGPFNGTAEPGNTVG